MTEYFYPERMGRIILSALEEVLGREGLNSTLRIASLASYIDHFPADRPDKTFPFATVSKLLGIPRTGLWTSRRARDCFTGGESLLPVRTTRVWHVVGVYRVGIQAFALSS